MIYNVQTPITDLCINDLKAGDMINISGYIYCGRDAVLPKIVELYKSNLLEKNNLSLEGSVIFHTAVSPAGVGPTSSNKLEIEESIGPLSEAGVKLHLGKGAIKPETVELLNKNNSVYAIIPPVTALLNNQTIEKQLVAFPEEGMEAFHMLKVVDFPAIIAAAHGKTIFDEV